MQASISVDVDKGMNSKKDVELHSTARRDGPLPDQIPPLNMGGSVALFAFGALLLVVTTRLAVPAFVAAIQAETVLMWFLAASIILFGPLVLTALLLLRRERRSGAKLRWMVRLWLRPMNRGDWLWTMAGLVAVGASSGATAAVLQMLHGRVGVPSFMAFDPLGPDRYWILGAWLPFFVLNIVGEEFVWRSVVLPRQVIAFGARAWLVNGFLWLLFHAAFPWEVLVTLVPITLLLPYIVQRRRNVWIGILIHAVFGAAGFLGLAFGLA